MLVSGKSFVLMLAALVVAATLAVLYVPSIGQAEQSATEATESTEKKQEKGDAKSTEDSGLQPTLIPFKFVLKRDTSGRTRLYMNDQPVADDVVRTTIGGQGKFVSKLQVSLSAEKGVDHAEVKRVAALLESLGVKNLTINSEWTVRDVNVGTADSGEVPDIAPVFVVGDDNPLETRSYAIVESRRSAFPAVLDAFKSGRDGRFLRFEYEWDAESGNAKISAAKAAHDKFFVGLIKTYNKGLIGPPRPQKFPSLEDQKLADLAWKRLGLELEPIADADLKRVKALGYDGGVKVTAGVAQAQGSIVIQLGDILVGLHVWPTTSMKDVAQVLERDDLAELNPFKFYVVRRIEDYNPKNLQEGQTPPRVVDVVESGRVSAKIDSSGFGGRANSSRYSATRPQPAPTSTTANSGPYQVTNPMPLPNRSSDIKPRPVVAGTAAPAATQTAPADNPFAATTAPVVTTTNTQPDKSNLRYDGKSFDEWRNTWKNELSTEKRAEAVKALAAFGRAGYGKEAAESILDVAAEYDFYLFESTPEGKLRETVLSELAPESRTQTLAPYWVAGLSERIGKDPKKWKWLAYWLFSKLQTEDADAIGVLQSLATSGDAELRGQALGALIRSSKAAPQFDDKTRKLIDDALQSKDPAVVRSALPSLVYTVPDPATGVPQPRLLYRPAMFPLLLFHADEEVRRQTRAILRFLDEKDAPQVVDQLLAVVKDKARERDHIEAIRGLAAIGGKAAKASPELFNILKSSDDQVTLAAAIVALVRFADKQSTLQVSGGGRQFNVDVLDEVFGKQLSDEERLALSKKTGEPNPEKFIERLTHENDALPPPNNPNLGGGGFF